MGIQVTEEAKVLVDGRAPKGLRERLYAWMVMRSVNRQIGEWKRDKGLTPGQKAARTRRDLIQNTVFRKWLNAFTALMAVVAVPTWAYSAVVATGWLRLLYAVLAAVFTYRVRSDYRVWRGLRTKEAELVVEDVHDS